jgi:hypothetical protein
VAKVWYTLSLTPNLPEADRAGEAAGGSSEIDLDHTVYALDSTTINLFLSVFHWAHSRSTNATVRMHTLLDLRGSISSFHPISEDKLHDVNALDLLLPDPGAALSAPT